MAKIMVLTIVLLLMNVALQEGFNNKVTINLLNNIIVEIIF